MQLELRGETQDPRQRAFLEFGQREIFPKMNWILALLLRYRAYKILVDSASGNADELQAWSGPGGAIATVIADYNAWSVDKTWTGQLERWAELAEGLEGPLANYARALHKQRQLEVFPEELKAALDEAELHQHNYLMAVNRAPGANQLTEFRKTANDIRRAFKLGQIDFQEAQRRLQANLDARGYHVVGHQAVQAAGAGLNQMAIVRTRLAQARGAKTWAEYQLEASGQDYTEPYRTPANQRQFLRAYIAGLRPLWEGFLDRRLSDLGLTEQKHTLRWPHRALLTLPDLELLEPHFPKEKITDIWEQTLRQSGFTDQQLSQIWVDDYARPNKYQTGAYMLGFIGPYTDVMTIDAQTLEFVNPPPGHASYRPGFAYILQTWQNAGVRDLETAFHEGGHALEHMLKYKNEMTEEAYGYVEVPSMTSERFAADVEILYHNAVPVEGVRPSRERIAELIQNSAKNEIVNLLAMAESALFDLELWDYDYTQPGAQTYLQRVESLSRELNALTGNPAFPDSQVPFFYAHLATSHFISGSVRNIGYTYAEIASRLMTEFIGDELQTATGRRTWYQQPGLAAIFSEKFFSVGWKQPFPLNIESITGRPFSPETVVREMRATLEPKDCAQHLVAAESGSKGI